MNITTDIWNTPEEYLLARQPDHPVHFFAPAALQAKAEVFLQGFEGLVSFAVKANPDPAVISNLLAAGIEAFDVASPNEIRLIRRLAPKAALHYHNPVRSRAEIRFAHGAGVRSYSVDGMREFAKLREIIPPEGIEISVRFKLPVSGAVYDFGEKFGAVPAKAIEILREVSAAGFTPSITFHPGTQCENRHAWGAYIIEAARIAKSAGVELHRLNVGGGFPCKMSSYTPDINAFFNLIKRVSIDAFDAKPPALVCEPGRALVAEAYTHATRVKGVRDDGAVFLNDGIYGGLSEFPILSTERNYSVLSVSNAPNTEAEVPVKVFGPTCDSLDVLPQDLRLPANIAEDDYVLFQSMGAYVNGVTTNFNGYGELETVTVIAL